MKLFDSFEKSYFNEKTMRLNFQNFQANGALDKTGAAVSWICALHCLTIPFIISFLPLLGISFLAREGVEYVFIAASIVIASVSLLPAYFRQHGKIRTLLLFTTGIVFIIFSDILFEENLLGKIVFVIVGALCITSAHFINRRLCADCRNCDEIHYHSLK